jgi:RNA polymerase sigma-70 factor, ECF subfamily
VGFARRARAPGRLACTSEEFDQMHSRSAVHTVQPHDDPSLGDAVTDFAILRPRLFALAHRVLGSWTDAEDVVQDAWMRWQRCDRSTVGSPTAFLVATTTRLALNLAQSARARRETVVARWPHEHVECGDQPEHIAGRDEALELGLQLLLERLTPTERAAYVLRVAFDYPYARIARLLQLSEVNARQIVSRAGRRLGTARPGPVLGEERRRLLLAFVSAARCGELEDLEQVLRVDALGPRAVCRRPVGDGVRA